MKKIAFIIIIALIVASCTIKKEGYGEILSNPTLEKLWETDSVLSDLESVEYDASKDLLYVSSINGHWLKPNGKGFISKVNLKGEVVNHKWIANIEGPTGLTLFKNRLFAADFDKIIEVDVNNASIIKKHIVNGAERINDVTVSEDGTVYGSGTKSGKLFALKKGKVTVVKSNLNWPNGLLVEGNHILIGLGDKSIQKFDLKTKSTSILTQGISNPDGIVAIGNGDYLISSWEGMIHYVTKNGKKTLLLDTTKEGINAADITYIPSKKMLLVPAMLKHKLIAYRLIDEK
ncbi:conserved protein of unknown function [Tenacibaculum sp. 190524A02b]|uniref:SMP-30/gluconolactonase/LRE family protein n=1 Tax=Tenacibaculum vairaonense TaxID=3137860 RepID=UPI0032B19383